ncbi:hypothetical protein [Methylobacter sp.]|uniref:hypothetical protein n=1 Tax=Methylobacter sp. TaxID=2051955 RepID=UPI002FDE17DF
MAVSEPLGLLPQLICSGNLMEITLRTRSAANIELKIKNIPATAHQSALYYGRLRIKRFIEMTWHDYINTIYKQLIDQQQNMFKMLVPLNISRKE